MYGLNLYRLATVSLILNRKCGYESLCYIVIDCGDPGMPDNGATTGSTTTFGSVVTHSCDDGFVLVGADERTCLESGNWSAPLPSCESKYITILLHLLT